jgi:hypothetical protein
MSHPYYFDLYWSTLIFAKVEGSLDLFGYHKFKFLVAIKYLSFCRYDRYYLYWNESKKISEKWSSDQLLPF